MDNTPPPKLIFRLHAVQRMFERNISEKDVRSVLVNGEMIENYEDDTPYPSRLLLGWSGLRPVHVVTAENKSEGESIVITVYEQDASIWEDDFKTRRQK